VVLVYVAVTALVAVRLGWGSRTTSLALLASVPPLGTLVFESWAERHGRFHRRPSRRPHGDRRTPT
jgi:hypothetical protein